MFDDMAFRNCCIRVQIYKARTPLSLPSHTESLTSDKLTRTQELPSPFISVALSIKKDTTMSPSRPSVWTAAVLLSLLVGPSGTQAAPSKRSALSTVTSGWTYQGCFTDGSTRALPKQVANSNSVNGCIANCQAAGYAVAGIGEYVVYTPVICTHSTNYVAFCYIVLRVRCPMLVRHCHTHNSHESIMLVLVRLWRWDLWWILRNGCV